MRPPLVSHLRVLLALLFAVAGHLLACHPCVAQGFPQPAVVKTGNWPAAIYTADLNGDGFPDLIYIDQGATPAASTTHVLLNDGKGIFTESAQIATAGDSLAIGDLLGNGGRGDIGWVSVNSVPLGPYTQNTVTLSVARGHNGTYAPPVTQSIVNSTYAKPMEFHHLLAGPVHQGLFWDIFAADTANGLIFDFLFLNPGPNYSSYQILTPPDGAGPMFLADLNQDQRNDLIVNATNAASVQVDLASPSGGFADNGSGNRPSGFMRFTGLNGIHSLLIQDVDGDGRPDLIAEGQNGRIDVFPGNGDGTFQTSSIGGTGALDGLSGNGGHLIGFTPLATGQPVAFTATPAGISSLLGQSNTYFGLNGIYNAGPGHTSYAMADFNGDRNMDIAVDSPEGIAILYGNPDGSLQSSHAFAAGQPALSIAAADLNADGNLDAVVSTAATQAQVLLGQGDGRLLAPGYPGTPVPTTSQTGPPGLWSQVAVGDFNGDGIPDLLLTADGSAANLPSTSSGLASGASTQTGLGNGFFAPPVSPVFLQLASCPGNPAQLYGSSAVADFNNDGAADFAVRDASLERIFLGSKTAHSYGLLSELPDPGCAIHAHNQVVTGDFNNDYLADLVEQTDGHLLVQLNGGATPFKNIGDLAVDGSLTTPGQLPAPDLSSSFGGFSSALGGNYAVASMAVADLDLSGFADLAVLYHNLAADPASPSPATPDYLYIWYGSGAGRFHTSGRHPVNPLRIQLSRNFYQLAFADLSGGGFPDLILSDGFLLDVQNNLADGTFGPEQHLLAGSGINGIAAGKLRAGSTAADLLVANGGQTLANPVANHETLTPNADVNTGGVTVLLNNAVAKPAANMGTLSASPEPSAFESPFTITATLSSTVSGTVQFAVDGADVGTAAVNANGLAAITGSATLLPGAHTLTATYFASASALAIALPPATHTVLRAPTSVSLTPTTPLTVYYGQDVDGIFSIYVQDQANYPYTGNYSLEDNGVDVPICIDLPTTQTCPYGAPILIDAGPHSFTVTYLGDPINAPGVSPAVPYRVLADLTTAALTASPNPAVLGSVVTLTATIQGNVAIPNGTAMFLDGTTVIGTATLNAAGVGTFQTSTLSPGQHSLSVNYPGTIDFNPASTAGAPVLEVIGLPATQLATVTTLTSSLNPAAPTAPVIYTAAVSVPGPFPIVATGTVSFTIDGKSAGTATLNSFGLAQLTSPQLAPGAHSVVATYGGVAGTGTAPIKPPGPPQPVQPRATTGTPTLLPSTSNTLIEVITYPLAQAPTEFTMTITPVPVSVGVGRYALLLVTITDLSGFNQPVALTCSGLPTESSCTFVQPILPPGGGATTLQLLVSAPHDCGDPAHPYFLGSNTPPTPLGRGLPYGAGLALAGVIGLGLRRRRKDGRHLRLLQNASLLALLLSALYSMSGCGRCTDLGTRPGNYSFTVTGVAQGGPVTETQSQTIGLTVTIP